jgi:hypothetical protein
MCNKVFDRKRTHTVIIKIAERKEKQKLIISKAK